MILYVLTIFLSAFLLFLVQPIIAKQILPWFGGTAAVWSTCLVFFQLALLAGYFYSDWITRKLDARRQVLLHIALIAVALLLLPIIPDSSWKPVGDEQPSWRILLLLTATIGLPYFLLSTTSPLIQSWYARERPGASPYRLFALSNLASMLALVGYPFLIEPNIATQDQATWWSMGFGVFGLLIAFTAWRAWRSNAAVTQVAVETTPAPTISQQLVWFALAALGSIMLLGVSNHLTQNISSIPLLWIVPLALYLLTFIVCFNASGNASTNTSGWYQRGIVLPQVALAIAAMAWLLAEKDLHFMLLLQIVAFSGGLFLTCLYCHGELAARKPDAQHLTTFYLMISIGGAFGAFLVGIVAPLVLPAYYELGFALYALAALATYLLWRQLPRTTMSWVRVSAGLVVALFAFGAAVYTTIDFGKNVTVMTRNFYGTLRVKETQAKDQEDRYRSLVHGNILHGTQYLDAPYDRIATTYYKTTSGVGLAIEQKKQTQPRALRVGIIGLGAGTIATYGSEHDVFRFYEINPEVVDIALRNFTYLKDTAATVEISLGDARLNLEREPAQQFDVLAIDAFSSDSIPVHLITREALQVYERHMQADGIIAFHVSNRFLDLKPVIQQLAKARGLHVLWINETRPDESTVSDWVLLCKDPEPLLKPQLLISSKPIPANPGLRIWTDDFNNIVQVLK